MFLQCLMRQLQNLSHQMIVYNFSYLKWFYEKQLYECQNLQTCLKWHGYSYFKMGKKKPKHLKPTYLSNYLDNMKQSKIKLKM